MYAVAPAADAAELHVTGRGRGIREIDLCAVLNTPEDRALLALITSFDLSHNSIARLQHLDALAALTRLDASHNHIVSLGALPLTIVRLDLSRNRLTALDGIGALPHLRELDASHNRLRALVGFSSSQPLQVLRADANRLVGLSGLEGMARLRVLSADSNLMESAGELMSLAAMPALEVLSLRGNSVAGVRGYRGLVARLQPSVLSLDGTPLLRGSKKEKEKEEEEEEEEEEEGIASPEIIAVVESRKGIQKNKIVEQEGERDHAIEIQLTATGNSQTLIGNGKAVASAVGSTVKGTTSTTATTTAAMATHNMAPKGAARGTALGTKSAVAETTNSVKALTGQRVVRQASNQSPSRTAQSNAESTRSTSTQLNTKTHTYATGKGNVNANESAIDKGAGNTQESRELREAHAFVAEMRKENNFLRGRIRTVEAQLHDARRVVSSQLDEINALRQQVTETAEREAALRERLDRTIRGARAAERRSHKSAEAFATERERMRTSYDTHIADLQQQLRRFQRGGIKKVSKPYTLDAEPSLEKTHSVEMARSLSGSLNGSAKGGRGAEIEDVVVEVSVGDLAGELKGWLYAEMAEDARRANEEASLQQLCESLARDEATTLQETKRLAKVCAAGADGPNCSIPRL